MIVFEDDSMKIRQILGIFQDGKSVKSSATLIEIEKTNYLVDCGAPEDSDDLIKVLDDLIIEKVILTHSHFDHCANLGKLDEIKKIQEIITFDTFGSQIIKSFHNGKILIMKTPGHSNHDICVFCQFSKKIVAISGDIFEDEDDENNGSWKGQSQNQISQNISRAFIRRISDIIVPGHGKFFSVKRKSLRSEFVTPNLSLKIERQLPMNEEDDETTEKLVISRFGDGEILVIDGKTDLKKFDLTDLPKIIVFVGTLGFKSVLNFIPENVYMETDIYSRIASNEGQYTSMTSQSTVRIQTGLLPDSAVIWRLPGPGGLIYPVFHYIDEYRISKFVFGALMGIKEDEKARFESLMLRDLVRINEGIV